MLYRRTETGELVKIQLSRFPACALFEQEIVRDRIVVRYHIPNDPLVPSHPLQHEVLEVPLEPDISSLEKIVVDLHGSPTGCYVMDGNYSAWFSACFGFETVLVFIGDGKRKVLGSMAPQPKQHSEGILSSISSYMFGSLGSTQQDEPWITFTDCAPFLVTTETSLRNVQQRSPEFHELPSMQLQEPFLPLGDESGPGIPISRSRFVPTILHNSIPYRAKADSPCFTGSVQVPAKYCRRR